MGTSAYAILALSSILMFSISLGTSSSVNDPFLDCLSLNSQTSIPISQIVYAPTNASYTTILQAYIKNTRFLSSTKANPQFIITPSEESQVQVAVICSKKHDLQIRVRSGGHDFEGLSYTSNVPFIIIDLFNLRSINVDIEDTSAWVQAGATIGELYSKIAEKSKIHGFPGAFGPSVGVAGLFSGGGYGTLLRKYGLSSDNVIDAQLVDVNGNILDRESMGEDLFWAIRGGGGASFGVIISFKVRLVSVPPTVTFFKLDKTLNQGATKIVHKWQFVANKFDDDLFIMIVATVKSNELEVSFECLFLGGAERLLQIMEKSFPELGLERKDCIEGSWIDSVVYLFVGYISEEAYAVLLNRNISKIPFKGKSDFVKAPLPEFGLEGIWKRMLDGEANYMAFVPYGGRMNEISESETPFPHRAGNVFMFFYNLNWVVGDTEKNIDAMRRMHNYLTPYVSNFPRQAYLNYRDLDLGANIYGKTSYIQALTTWGTMYFKNNFQRLALVKSKVDPDNFFWNEQSIPPLPIVTTRAVEMMTWVE